ncbi:hypothetical protein ACFLYU_03635 [Candidatus Dependentiae bacterium]
MKSLRRCFVFAIFLLSFLIGTSSKLFAMKKEKEGTKLRLSKLKLFERFKSKNKFNLKHDGVKAISKCGNYVVSGDNEGPEVIVFYVKNGKQKCSYNHSDTDADCSVFCVLFSGDGNYVASGSIDGEIIVFDMKNNEKKCLYWMGASVSCMSFSNNGNDIASGSVDGEVIVFDIERNEKKCSYWCRNENKMDVSCVSLSRDCNYVISGFKSGFNVEVIVYDIKMKKEKFFYKGAGNAFFVSFLGEKCEHFVLGNKSILRVFDVKYGQKKYSYRVRCSSICGVLSKCCNYFASGSYRGKVAVFDIKKNRLKFSYEYGNSPVRNVCLSNNNNYIVSGSGFKGRTVIVFDLIGNKKSCLYRHIDRVMDCCFSKDGSRLVSVSEDGQVIVHETSSEFYHSNNIYENKKKQNKLVKQNLKKMAKNFSDVKILLKK